jgi:nickel/cobalt transporter (NicO) family protein
MNADLGALCAAAVSIGFLHTLFGPDHYVPFVAMSRAGRWSRRKTLLVTLACGLAHVGSSVVLGVIGLGLGLIVFQMEKIESQRGNVAGWLLIGFGVAYFAWGLVRALRNQPHVHVHAHSDGTVHAHEHAHFEEHLHPHAATPAMTPWVLFAIFAFGPCEPLIPLLMYPAAQAELANVAWVTALFALTTLATMTGMVLLMSLGADALRFNTLDRYSHAAAGFVLLSCGLAVKLGA